MLISIFMIRGMGAAMQNYLLIPERVERREPGEPSSIYISPTSDTVQLLKPHRQHLTFPYNHENEQHF